MRPVTEREIRASFVNCSKGEAKRLSLPKGFGDLPWDDLDFLGWRDPGAPERAYLVAEHDGANVGIALRVVSGTRRGFTSRTMCSLCLTTRTGGAVTLMTAQRTGDAGRRGDSVGRYLCGDLACSLYTRSKKQSATSGPFDETLSTQEKIVRTQANLHTFLHNVTR